MASVRYVAMCGELQISPCRRLCYDTPNPKDASAMADKRRWDRQHPDKPATIVEVKVDR